ncbi:DNA polymerase [Lapillicoccus sp.]|uniref:DNA polymerase n=1 Tax=Lapillicoccus sp. TaxID=1909287 RepID=UPI0025E189C4|nr:DNA polymerase [Lapillicoccus sp.]
MPTLLPLVVAGRLGIVGSGPGAVVGSVKRIVDEVRRQEAAQHPRWLVTSAGDARVALLAAGVRVDRCWDVAEVHRLLHGGWTAAPPQVWASVAGLDPAGIPTRPSGDLFDFVAAPSGAPQDHPDSPLRSDGHLRVDAFEASWATSEVRLRALADLLIDLAGRQEKALVATGPRAVRTAHSESAAAILCVELERDGLPVDRATAEELIELSAGPRPTSEADAARIRSERDRAVLEHAPGRGSTDLRNPVQVRELLAAVGVQVPNTRAHVLEPFRATHPVVEALLRWRKDERIATTYGYRWLDEHVGADDRLRGGWSACDGAAGRMTAQNGLHNLPVPLRPAIAAAEGWVFVRADLGQIEPRVLAVVSGDRAFAEATRSDDLYAPVAAKLRIERPVAKIAVLAAMYGQRSGSAGEALKDLERAYPVAMRLLDDAYAAGLARRPLRTFGGRLIALDRILGGAPEGTDGTDAAGLEPTGPPAERVAPGQGIDAARGRFARNAIIQGAAAELFKAWAATVRHAVAPLGAQIVLCLHDELLVHAPQQHADEVAALVGSCLDDSARRWSGTDRVRFVADTSVIRRWSEAKG